MLLRAKSITVHYGPVKALEGASFEVGPDEIVAMIGPNGAGKSTALKAVTGLLQEFNGELTAGTIEYEGRPITGLRTDQLSALGIGLVPEGRRVFHSMTVLENLEMGGYCLKDKKDVRRGIDSAFELLPHLRQRARQKAGTLSTGEQQMLAIGRALVPSPRLLLADEPSLGLSPNYVELIFEKLQEINRAGASVLLVEQNVYMALEVAHRGYVFDIGRIASWGSTTMLKTNPALISLMLGARTAPR